MAATKELLDQQLAEIVETEKSEFASLETWRSTLAEFIATLIFVFIGAGTVVVSGALDSGDLTSQRVVAIAMAHGFAIALLVYATANISGGHINPVVSLAAMLTKKITFTKGFMFIAAQLIGGASGALLVVATIPNAVDAGLGAHGLGQDVTAVQGFLMEVIITFTLVFTVFAVALDPRGMGRFAPLAIGLTVLVAHLVAVPVTGASMNPARTFGPALVAGNWDHHWVYWLGPLSGGVIAGLLYQFAFIGRPAWTKSDSTEPLGNGLGVDVDLSVRNTNVRN